MEALPRAYESRNPYDFEGVFSVGGAKTLSCLVAGGGIADEADFGLFVAAAATRRRRKTE